jgi:DNA-binding MarR family transcriptional regulator
MNSRAAVERIRHFNRYYTRLIGLLDGEYLASACSLAEARILFEIGRGKRRTAKAIRGTTGMDAGYLSRILAALAKRGLLVSSPSAEDGRLRELALTPAGESELGRLDRRSSASIAGLIGGLSAAERDELVTCLERARELIGEAGAAPDEEAGNG